MRQVVGNSVRQLDAAAFAEICNRYDELVLDLGTGDGKHARHVARQRPRALVVGLDASPDAVRATSAKAARKPDRGGTANVLFIWASAEQLPGELCDVTEVNVLMPWGSLLRSVVAPDPTVLRGVADVCRAGASFLVTLNLHAWRPPVAEIGALPEPTPDSVLAQAAAFAAAGWHIEQVDYLTDDALAALGTSWTRRLGSSRAALSVLGMTGRIG